MINHIIKSIKKDIYDINIKFDKLFEEYIYLNNHTALFHQDIYYCYSRMEIGAESVIIQLESCEFRFVTSENIAIVDFYRNGKWISLADKVMD